MKSDALDELRKRLHATQRRLRRLEHVRADDLWAHELLRTLTEEQREALRRVLQLERDRSQS